MGRMPFKRAKQSYVERLLQLELVTDKKQCRKKRNSKKHSNGDGDGEWLAFYARHVVGLWFIYCYVSDLTTLRNFVRVKCLEQMKNLERNKDIIIVYLIHEFGKTKREVRMCSAHESVLIKIGFWKN